MAGARRELGAGLGAAAGGRRVTRLRGAGKAVDVAGCGAAAHTAHTGCFGALGPSRQSSRAPVSSRRDEGPSRHVRACLNTFGLSAQSPC